MPQLSFDTRLSAARPRLCYTVLRRAGSWAIQENGRCAGAFRTREAALEVAGALARDARGVGYDARVDG
jgi:hypothetical protein